MAIDYGRFDQWERWIPSIQGQRDLAKTDPDKVASMELRFMTRAERKRLMRLSVSAAMERVSDEEHDKALREIFDDHIRGIRNLTSGGRPITKGGDLLDVDDDNFVFEITEALKTRSALEEGLAKNLCSPSDSKSSGQNSSTDGGAQAAIQQSPEGTPAEQTSKEI